MKILERSQPDKDEDEGTEIEYCATCRPCCTIPHGPVSVTSAVLATIGFIFAIAAFFSCNYMHAEFQYCVPRPPLFGNCGACHCIVEGDDTCPTGDAIPRSEFSQETVDQWKVLTHLNPMTLDCNPYKNRTCTTQPPQQYTELWEEAVCGIKCDNNTLDENQCPTAYETVSYPNLAALEADPGAELTHYGTCGVCSSLQDLAVYVENPDLTAQGQMCGLIGLVDLPAAVKCFEDAGYSTPCAEMWVYNTMQTRDMCFDICIDFTFENRPNNGPAPECEIARCLQCDEDFSGPYFKTVAARTRRRSGLLSKIARPCSAILLVNHKDSCKLTSGTTPIPARTDTAPVCHDQSANMGPLFYETIQSNLFLDIDFLLSSDERLGRSFYRKCTRINLKRAVGGYWKEVGEKLGAAWRTSSACALIAFLLGLICTVLVWASTCAAFRQNFWLAMAISFTIASFCEFLTFVIFAADVCPEGGCKFLDGGVNAIVAGVLWGITAVLCWMTKGPTVPGQTIQCCCCPTAARHHVIEASEGVPLVKSVAAATTTITITESVDEEGNKVTKKLSMLPDGSQSIETTTTKMAGEGIKAEAPAEEKTSDVSPKGPPQIS